MATCATTNYFLVWDRASPVTPDGYLAAANEPRVDRARLGLLANGLTDSKVWGVDARRARTINPLFGTQRASQLADPTLFICGFFITTGSVDELIRRAGEIDMSFMSSWVGRMDDKAKADLEAHTTLTFAPVDTGDASVMVLWARFAEGPPSIPVELVLDVITAYNQWARRLHDGGVLLDTGRLNVRYGTSHIERGQESRGRQTAGQLVALGTMSTEGRSIADAVKMAGPFEDDMVVDIAACNGWCSKGDGVEYEDDPRNTLFV